MPGESLPLPSPIEHRMHWVQPRHAVWLSAAMVVLWAVWAALFNTAQFGDNVEQFNWAQSLELGYHKHPPLPSWALAATVMLFGPSIYWAYVLATLCLLGTLAFTFLIGRRLVGDRVAAAAVVLWGLNLSFSQRVQLYNHNTVLVLFIAAAVWCAMRATSTSRARPLWWAATGLAAAAAILSKYQAVVPLGGLVLALAWTGRLRQPAQRHGMLLALAVLVLACAPHAVWVARHDFSTLRYAATAVEASGPAERIGFVVSFLANQVRFAGPPLLAIALCWWARDRTPGAARSDATVATDFGVWMLALIWCGMLVLGVMALAAGVGLRNHWGVQALQFSCIWLAYEWDRRSPVDLTRLAIVAVLLHALGLAWYAGEHRSLAPLESDRRIDTMYPARSLAHAAVAHWKHTTSCPLRYVSGTMFDAGLVSLYSGGELKVFDSEQATPWVRVEDVQRDGALYVLDPNEPVPPGVIDIVGFESGAAKTGDHPARVIRLGVLPPAQPCR